MKQGAENMINMYNAQKVEKKLLAEAQQMLLDAKNKVEYIRMQILKEQQKETSSAATRDDHDDHNGARFHPEKKRAVVCYKSFFAINFSDMRRSWTLKKIGF